MPRNPDRIRPVLDAVEVMWRLVPDFRLAQLIEVVGASFSTEDDELIGLLEADLATLVPGPPWGPGDEQFAQIQVKLAELRQRATPWD